MNGYCIPYIPLCIGSLDTLETPELLIGINANRFILGVEFDELELASNQMATGSSFELPPDTSSLSWIFGFLHLGDQLGIGGNVALSLAGFGLCFHRIGILPSVTKQTNACLLSVRY